MCTGLMRYRGTWDINAIGLTLLREDQRDAYSASSGRGSKTRTVLRHGSIACLLVRLDLIARPAASSVGKLLEKAP